MSARRNKVVLRSVLIVLVISLFISSLYYMVLVFKIRKTAMGFKQACVENDVKSALGYIDPIETRIPLLISAGVLEAYEALSGDESVSKKVLTAVVNSFLGTELHEDELRDFAKTLKYSRAFLCPGFKSCWIQCYLRYSIGGEMLKKKIRIKFVNREGDWYIYSISGS